MKRITLKVVISIILVSHLFCGKVKDVADFEEGNDLLLTGYGIVTGLNSTGDRNLYLTQQAMGNMMANLGINITPQQLKTRNSASVIVTARVSPFVYKGQKIDVEVSSIGDATSIDGGSLIRTALYDKHGNLVAFAQGVVISKKKKTSGLIPNGGEIYQPLQPQYDFKDTKIKLFLKKPDYTTAIKIEKKINLLKDVKANVISPSAIEIEFSTHSYNKLELISIISELETDIDTTAKIVINSSSGDIIVHGRVEVMECSITVGDMEIEINGEKDTKHTQNSINVKSRNIMDLIKALNQIKVKPSQMIEIIKTLHSAGFINGELEII